MAPKKWIIIVLFFIGLSDVFAQEKYKLSWGIEKGRKNEFKRTITVEKFYCKFYAKNATFNGKDALKSVDDSSKKLVETIKLECIYDWSLPKVENDKGYIYIYFLQGKITLTKGNEVEICDTTNKEDMATKGKSGKFLPYIGIVTGAFAFYMDFLKGDVESTWALRWGKGGKPEQILYHGPNGENDPLGIGDIYKQIPSSPVPVGAKWESKQVLGSRSRIWKFNFSEVTSYKSYDVAKLEITGEIDKKLDRAVYFEGTISGKYLLDYKRNIMVTRDITEIEKEVYKDVIENSYYINETKTNILIEISKTNKK